MYKYQTLWIKETSLGLRYIYLPWAPGPNSPVPRNSIVEFIEHLAPSTAPPARRRLFKPRPTTHHRYNLRLISTNNLVSETMSQPPPTSGVSVGFAPPTTSVGVSSPPTTTQPGGQVFQIRTLHTLEPSLYSNLGGSRVL